MLSSYDPQIDTPEIILSAAYLHLHLPHGNNAIHIESQLEEEFQGNTTAEFIKTMISRDSYDTD